MTTLNHRELSTVLGGRGGHCSKGHHPRGGGQGALGPRSRSMGSQGGGGPSGGMQPAAQGGDGGSDAGASPMTQGAGAPQSQGGSSGGGNQLSAIVGQMAGLMQQLQSAVGG